MGFEKLKRVRTLRKPQAYLSSAQIHFKLTPNFSNIDFFLEILALKDDELVMSEM